MMDDLISRQAAIEALEDAGMTNYLATGDFYGIINALTVIKNMPTAEPKKGKWTADGTCPFCSYIQQFYDDNFCANCGARMEESDG